MRRLQLAGVRRGKGKRTTFPGEISARPQDLVERSFVAAAPNRLWVADLTYVSTWGGFVYITFVVDVFRRRIVGLAVSASLQPSWHWTPWRWAIWARRAQQLEGLVHHSDRGVRLGHPLHRAPRRGGAVRSVGSRGASYDNALAETVVGLYMTEIIRHRRPWRSLEQVELATAEWVDWWNQRRLPQRRRRPAAS